MEKWKYYNDFLKVSDLGRFKRVYKTKEVEIFGENINGYIRIHLKNGDCSIKEMAHRLVWKTFVGKIPDGFVIDHINTIRDDNRLENLRCVTPKGNANNPLTKQKISEYWKGKPQPIAVEAMRKAKLKSVSCFTKDGVLVSKYNSLTDASIDKNVELRNISAVLRGKRKTAGGYVWKYN